MDEQNELDDIKTFANRIRQKTGAYDDVDDNELTERFIRKNPVYADRVKLPQGFRLLQTSSGYQKIDDIYEQMGREENVDPNLLLEQGRQETINFKPDVFYGRVDSPKAAKGAGQFMKGTAPLYGLTVNDQVDERADPIKSIRAQAKYMRKLLDQFDGREDLALAGYNAGEGRTALKQGRVPNIKETQDYVKNISSKLQTARNKGLTLHTFLPQQENNQSLPNTENNSDIPQGFQSEPDPAYMAQFEPSPTVQGVQTLKTSADFPTVKQGEFDKFGNPNKSDNPTLGGSTTLINNPELLLTRPRVVGEDKLNENNVSDGNTTANNAINNSQYSEWLNLSGLTDSPENQQQFSALIQNTVDRANQLNKAESLRTLSKVATASKNPQKPLQVPTNSNTPNAVPTVTDDRIASVVNIDLANRPRNENVGRYMLRSALELIAPDYGFDENDINQELMERNEFSKWGDNLSNEEADKMIQEGNNLIPFRVTKKLVERMKERKAQARVSDSQPTEEDKNQALADSVYGTDEQLRQQITERLNAEKQARNNPTLGQSVWGAVSDAINPLTSGLPNAWARVYDIATGQKDTPVSQDEIDAEVSRVKDTQLTGAELARSKRAADVLNNTNASSLYGGLFGGAGRTITSVAGILRPFESLGFNFPKGIAKAGQQLQMTEAMTGDNSFGSNTLKTLGGLPYDLARIGLLSRLPGGAVIGFSADSVLQSAGRGESLQEIGKQGTKGAAMGGLFPLGAKAGEAVSKVAPFFEPVVRLGTIGVGTTGIEYASGTPLPQAVQSGILNVLFDATQHYGGQMFNKVGRIWKEGKPIDVKIDESGNVSLVRFKGEENPNRVDFEMVLDPTDGVYKSADEVGRTAQDNTQPIRENQNAESTFRANTTDSPIEQVNDVQDFSNNSLAVRENKFAPESVETLDSQVRSMMDNTTDRTGVLVTDGETMPQTENALQIPTSDGVLLVNPVKAQTKFNLNSPEEIAEFVQSPENLKSLLGETNQDLGAITPQVNFTPETNTRPIQLKESPLTQKNTAIQKPVEVSPNQSIQTVDDTNPTIKTVENLPDNVSEERNVKTMIRHLQRQKNQPLETLLKMAKAEIQPDGNFHLNAQAAELIRRTQGGDSVFLGAYATPYQVHKLRTKIQDLIPLDTPRSKAAELIKEANRFHSEMTMDDEASPYGVADSVLVVTNKMMPKGYSKAIEEELSHQATTRLGEGDFDDFAHVDGYKQALTKIVDSGVYSDLDSFGLHREVIGKVFRSDAETELGITPEQVENIQGAYLENVINQGYNLETVKKAFAKINNEKTRSFIDNAERKFNERTRRNIEENGRRITNENVPASQGSGNLRTIGSQNSTTNLEGTTADKLNRVQSGGLSRDTEETTQQIDHSDKLTPYEKDLVNKKFPDNPELKKQATDDIAFSKPMNNKPTTLVGKAAEKVYNTALEAISIPKSLKSSVDLSATLRQGGVLTLSEPIIGGKSFWKQIKSLFSERYFQRFKRDLNLDGAIELAEDSGLYLSTLQDGSINAREEAFMSRLLSDDKYFANDYLEKFRRVGTFHVRVSERAYQTYLDNLRMETFKKFAAQIHEYNVRKGQPDEPEQYKAIADFINKSTGRGNLGSLENAAPILNAAFFSVRNWVSRFQLLNPLYYAKLPPKVRQIALTKMLQFGATTALAMLLLKAGGAKIELSDTEDGEWLKASFGAYHYDLGAGFIQPLRLMGQLYNAASDRYQDKTPESSEGALVWKYLRTKFAPILSSVVNLYPKIYTGKNVVGQDVTLQSEALGLITPMTFSDLTQAGGRDGTLGVLKATPIILGTGLSLYDSKDSPLSDDIKNLFKGLDMDTPTIRKKHKIHEELEIELTSEQQKDYQAQFLTNLSPVLETVTKSSDFQKLTEKEQKKVIKGVIQDYRESFNDQIKSDLLSKENEK